MGGLDVLRLNALHVVLQDQQRLKQAADKARQLAVEQGDELARAQARMQQMQAELTGVTDTAREQLLELDQLKGVGAQPLTCG